MAAPKYSIASVSEPDLPFLANFIHAAKLSLSINRLIFKDWPNEALQKQMYSEAVQDGYSNPSMECFKAVDVDSNEIVGYFVLARKRPVKESLIDSGSEGEAIPDGFNLGLFREMTDATIQIAKQTDAIDRFEIVYMCVKPSYQCKGIGSKLVQLGFDRARAEGIPFAVCAEAPAHEFFIKLGFKDTTHYDIDLRKYAPAYSGFGIFRLSGMMWRP
ncbi:uncharacterized protein N7498_006046 [Penicillium cinerascens]|uniref:N-acetyltransferase domain-containing protein n=1 Tax=Penicillium cinerascens TaxID=70096 RepID=A0A9W9MHG1_9EURO|nr:uncharacterized protein N7498_006046 [Penicillium cinerascens]KAJ5201383.1 hypothetical protein N7498_006046 [Penicillium cinerascens]